MLVAVATTKPAGAGVAALLASVKVTAVAPLKLVPVSVTLVPSVPVLGVKEAMVGGAVQGVRTTLFDTAEVTPFRLATAV